MLPKEFIERYTDFRNQSLFAEISSKYDFNLDDRRVYGWPNQYPPWYCEVYTDTHKATIIYYQDTNTSAYFTHELFHVDLIENKGFTNTDKLEINIENVVSNGLPDKDAIRYINNSLAHQKFYK